MNENKQIKFYSEEVEKIILGSLIVFEVSHRYITNINEGDFYIDINKKIFKVIVDLYKNKSPINIVSIKERFIFYKYDVTGIIEYLSNIVTYVITSEIDYYLKKLKNYSTRRKLFSAGQNIIKKISECDNDIDATDLKKDCLKEIIEIKTEDVSIKDSEISNIIVNSVENIENKYNKKDELTYRTGFFDLDKITDGLHQQEFTIIAARPGVGKTAFGLQLGTNIAKKGTYTYIASLEMSDVQIGNRLISNESKIDGHKLRMGWLEEEDWDKIAKVSGELATLPILLDTKSTTIQEIENRTIELKETKKLGLVIIDYLQLLKSKEKYNLREQEVADISRRLKLLSRDLDIPIIALCQLNRETEKRKRPILADLRESGSLEQDADNVIFLYVEEEEKAKQMCMNISVIVAKQRNGTTGEINMRFNRKIMNFQNLIK